MIGLIPLPYRILIAVAIFGAVCAFAWFKGASHVQKKWDAAVLSAQLAAAKKEVKREQATIRVVEKFVDRVKTVREAGKTIVKEVPVYVTVEADSKCVIPTGFISLHNAAATSLPLPEPSGDVDEASAEVTLSAIAETVALNYTICGENSEQLIGLQDWVREQQKIGNSK